METGAESTGDYPRESVEIERTEPKKRLINACFSGAVGALAAYGVAASVGFTVSAMTGSAIELARLVEIGIIGALIGAAWSSRSLALRLAVYLVPALGVLTIMLSFLFRFMPHALFVVIGLAFFGGPTVFLFALYDSIHHLVKRTRRGAMIAAVGVLLNALVTVFFAMQLLPARTR